VLSDKITTVNVIEPETVAARLLRQARRRREWSQAELARRAGIPASQLCAYETGVKQPGAATLARILAVAGMTLSAGSPGTERYRQAQELADVLALVDAMPPRPRRTPPPTFRDLRAS
jgi:transcriptional regulator with XRE-family HTH domain